MERIRRINFVALAVVVVYTMVVVKIIGTLEEPIFGPLGDSFVVFLTSVGFYMMIVSAIFNIIDYIPFLQKFYWGSLYVSGLWSYVYTIEGDKEEIVYFGVWKFQQTLYDTSVVGFGLTEKFTVRSRVRSASDMIKNGNMYEFINIRSDSVGSANEYYSRTSMFFELNKNLLLRYPVRMRGQTMIYGGPLNGRICNNLFVKHEGAKTEEDVIEALRKIYAKHKRIDLDSHRGPITKRGLPELTA